MINPELMAWLQARTGEFGEISDIRKPALEDIARHIKKRLKQGQVTRPLFVCTHNSRRSQMAQAVMLAAAHYYGYLQISPSSAGTSVTAFHFNAVMALEHAGFIFITLKEGDNPVYGLQLLENEIALDMFSKNLENPGLPQSGFFAVMVCDHADANCPYVPGAEARFSLHYEDPGKYDETEDPLDFYDQALKQIGRELMYLTAQISEQKNRPRWWLKSL